MTSSPYRLQPADKLSVHGSRRPRPPRLLHDHDNAIDTAQVHKLIASGDGFISLATAVTDMMQLTDVNPKKAGADLEKLILTLMYLQDNYEIYRKLTPHP